MGDFVRMLTTDLTPVELVSLQVVKTTLGVSAWETFAASVPMIVTQGRTGHGPLDVMIGGGGSAVPGTGRLSDFQCCWDEFLSDILLIVSRPRGLRANDRILRANGQRLVVSETFLAEPLGQIVYCNRDTAKI